MTLDDSSPSNASLPPSQPPLVPGKHLGTIAIKSDPRALMFAHYLGATGSPPRSSNFWRKRAAFAQGDWGNRDFGDCTIASQVVMFRYFERIERRRSIEVATAETLRVYFDMTERLYGGGDTGAYEDDALSQSRSPETCLHDLQGHPLLIDAFTQVDSRDLDLIRWAIALAPGHCVKVCFDLPLAFSRLPSPAVWDIPVGQPLIGDWRPNSWGGHSMTAFAYDAEGMWWFPTWDEPAQLITWRAVAAYCSLVHSPIDSVDAWRKRPAVKKNFDIEAVVKQVNKVSRTKIKPRKAA